MMGVNKMPKLTATEWEALKKDLLDTIRKEFQTKDGCISKKESYMRADICLERTQAMDEKIDKIEVHLGNLDTKVGNHITHIAADIAGIKASLKPKIAADIAGIKASLKPKEDADGENSGAFIINKKLGLLIIGGYGLLLGAIVYLIEKIK